MAGERGISFARQIVSQALRLYGKADPKTLALRLKFRDIRHAYYRQLWDEAARNVGALAKPWRGGRERIVRGNKSTIVYLTQVNLNPPVLSSILMDKVATQELLTELGHPVPRQAIFDMASYDLAVQFLKDNEGQVVVKPASGTAGGAGVTTNISDAETLKRAARAAAWKSDKIIVEQHVTGGSYRLMFVGGKYVDGVRRDPPTVTGDGKLSIRALIRQENRRRLQAKPVSALLGIRTDTDCHQTLASQGMALSTVPAAGETVRVKTSINDNSSNENHNVRDVVHSTTIEMGETIMAQLGISLGGIDIQSTDITKPLCENGGAVIEINCPPGIHHHYLLANRESITPVAEHILEHIFSTGEGAFQVSPGGRIDNTPQVAAAIKAPA